MGQVRWLCKERGQKLEYIIIHVNFDYAWAEHSPVTLTVPQYWWRAMAEASHPIRHTGEYNPQAENIIVDVDANSMANGRKSH